MDSLTGFIIVRLWFVLSRNKLLENIAEDLFKKVSNLTRVTGRQEAARELAEYLGADELIIFINDPVIGMLLPAPGFPQTLSGGRAWQKFLAECAEIGDNSATLLYPGSSTPVTAYGFLAGDGSVLVLLGGRPVEKYVITVKQLLPMLAAAFNGERMAQNAASQARVAHAAAEQAHQLVEALDSARRELQQALQQRDQFLSIAAHELKTPLTSIMGFSQALLRRAEKEHLLGERDLHVVKIIKTQSGRMQKLIEDFFNQGRLQAGLFDLHIDEVDLLDLIRQAVDELQLSLDRHVLHLDSGEFEKIPILADNLRLHLVLQNLLHNAVKYSVDGGVVLVRTWQKGDCAFFSVTDSGIGVPLEDQPHLFDRFYRADNAQRNHLGGLGIGLFLVKEIITRHGGSITVESIEGQGSTFTVCLPTGI
jgi:signal transduction histidine kinase